MSDAKTTELVQRWKEASRRVLEAEAALNRARAELSNAANALGSWLTPKDLKPGEFFNAWVEDELVQVRAPFEGKTEYQISTWPARRRRET